MSLAFYWIPVRHGENVQADLNRALRTLRVISVEKHFCPNPGDPGWAVCIEHVETRPGEPPARDGSGKAVDYREVLMSAAWRCSFRPSRAYYARRVVRGGSYWNNARNCRSAYRNTNEPGNRNRNLGFRLAAAHPPEGLAADPAFEASGFAPARSWPLRVLVGAWRRARTLPERRNASSVGLESNA